ncbi:hypothetical protein A7982_12579 [Minicystis rosea]|nr:hypothetical protein A7982_12579 [Minicystis rosea]
MTLILLPTVEVEPSGWAEPGYEKLIHTDAWDALWERSLSRWQLEPITPHAWQVSTASFVSEEALTNLLSLQLRRSGVQDFLNRDGEVEPDERRISSLYGGYVLFDADGRRIAFPSCCCDLADLAEWRRAASLVDGKDALLDIGHGNWSARREGTSVLLTQGPEWHYFEPITTSVPADELLAATYVAERAVEAFRLRLLPILHRLVEDGTKAERLSLLMVGLPVK